MSNHSESAVPAVPLWQPVKDYRDIRFETAEGIAKITINRPEVRNAFRPQTLFELSDAFRLAQDDPGVGVIVLTGEGTLAFCSGGDQRIRGDDGYIGDDAVGQAGIGKSRLAWELEKYLDGVVETILWHEGRSPAYGEGISYWALAEMVRGRAGITESDDPATSRARLGEILAQMVPDDAERKWIEQSLIACARIQEMVARMQRIARVQYLEGESRSLPRLFDLRKASDTEESPGTPPPPASPKSR